MCGKAISGQLFGLMWSSVLSLNVMPVSKRNMLLWDSWCSLFQFFTGVVSGKFESIFGETFCSHFCAFCPHCVCAILSNKWIFRQWLICEHKSPQCFSKSDVLLCSPVETIQMWLLKVVFGCASLQSSPQPIALSPVQAMEHMCNPLWWKSFTTTKNNFCAVAASPKNASECCKEWMDVLLVLCTLSVGVSTPLFLSTIWRSASHWNFTVVSRFRFHSRLSNICV